MSEEFNKNLMEGGIAMEEEKIGVKFIATVTGLKGSCHANHKAGQKFELNCYDSGGLCGFFIMISFPTLM